MGPTLTVSGPFYERDVLHPTPGGENSRLFSFVQPLFRSRLLRLFSYPPSRTLHALTTECNASHQTPLSLWYSALKTVFQIFHTLHRPACGGVCLCSVGLCGGVPLSHSTYIYILNQPAFARKPKRKRKKTRSLENERQKHKQVHGEAERVAPPPRAPSQVRGAGDQCGWSWCVACVSTARVRRTSVLPGRGSERRWQGCRPQLTSGAPSASSASGVGPWCFLAYRARRWWP